MKRMWWYETYGGNAYVFSDFRRQKAREKGLEVMKNVAQIYDIISSCKWHCREFLQKCQCKIKKKGSLLSCLGGMP